MKNQIEEATEKLLEGVYGVKELFKNMISIGANHKGEVEIHLSTISKLEQQGCMCELKKRDSKDYPYEKIVRMGDVTFFALYSAAEIEGKEETGIKKGLTPKTLSKEIITWLNKQIQVCPAAK